MYKCWKEINLPKHKKNMASPGKTSTSSIFIVHKPPKFWRVTGINNPYVIVNKITDGSIFCKRKKIEKKSERSINWKIDK